MSGSGEAREGKGRLASIRAQAQPLLILFVGVLVGFAVGGASIVFHKLIDLCQFLALGSAGPPVEALAGIAWFWWLLIPAIGGLLVGPIVFFWASEARGHGVPEVIEAVQVREGVIRPRIAVAKSIASAITIGTGGSVGQEGPVIQIGSALGSVFAQTLHLSREHRRTLIGCGAAAGIAAMFNAPIAGAFFALEVILGNFAIPTFSPIVLSSVVATTVSRGYFGNTPIFHVPAYQMTSWWELLSYSGLGLVCGVGSALFIVVLYATEDAFDRSPIPRLARPVLGGLVVGALFFASPHLYGSGFASMSALLQDEIPWRLALALFALKMVACSVTLASGGSGGVFSPSLFLGATIGYAFGHLVGFVAPGVTGQPAAYALVGMGAMVSGTTHAPVTAILILFEMTNDYGIILPIMVAITIATLVARVLVPESIYTRKLLRKGVRIFGARDDLVMNAFRARDVMRAQVPSVPADAPFPKVLERFLNAPIGELFVVDATGKLLGEISLHDVKGIVGEDDLQEIVIAKDLISQKAHTLEASDSLADCLQEFAVTGRDSLPVVASHEDGIPIGILGRRDLIDLYDREVLRREMVGAYGSTDRGAPSPLPAGFRLEQVVVPASWVGKTIRDLTLRQRTGVTVVGIRRGGRPGSADPADPERSLHERDVLVVLGTNDSVERLGRLVGSD